MQLNVLCIAVGLASILIHAFVTRIRARKFPKPPGPKPLPIIGNFFDAPSSYAWLKYQEWRNIYGDLIYYTVFGKDIFVINSAKVCDEILEKNAHLFADRPDWTMLQLMGWGFGIGFMRWGERWRRHRKIYHQLFHSGAAVTFRPIQESKTHELLRQLLDSPNDSFNLVQTSAASTAMRMIYGYDVKDSKNDRFLGLLMGSVEGLGVAVSPVGQLFDAYPILQNIPGWLPGVTFKTVSRRCRAALRDMNDTFMKFVRENSNIVSVTSQLLEQGKESQEDIEAVGVTSFIAGADTSSSSVLSFILAMVLNPDAQRKGQEEIDRVVGSKDGNRMPTWEDRDSLPYIEAIYQEVMRWRPSVPANTPHAAMEDYAYGEYIIPKGAIVIANTWAITHDENVYPEPDTFKPERFLTADGKIANKSIAEIRTYGSGRRVCAGRHVGDASVWIAIVSMLSVYTIQKVKKIDGTEVPVDGGHTDDLISRPTPFQCSFRPRSEAAKKLIIDTAIALD